MSKIVPLNMAIKVGDGMSDPRITFNDAVGNRYHAWLHGEDFAISSGGFGAGKARGKPTVYRNPPDGKTKPREPGYFSTQYIDLSAKAHSQLASTLREFIGNGDVVRNAITAAAEKRAKEDEAETKEHAEKVRQHLRKIAEVIHAEGAPRGLMGQAKSDLLSLCGCLSNDQLIRFFGPLAS